MAAPTMTLPVAHGARRPVQRFEPDHQGEIFP
jgi:hypothetical protein